jgi:hypothetical protein
MANSNRKLGGGSGSRTVREVGVRNSTGPREMNVRAVSQIGQALGNKSTDSAGRTVGKAAEVMRGRAMPAVFGNEKALDVGAGGPGTGRKLYGQSGSQKQYGTSPTGLPRIADTRGQWPDTNTKPR